MCLPPTTGAALEVALEIDEGLGGIHHPHILRGGLDGEFRHQRARLLVYFERTLGVDLALRDEICHIALLRRDGGEYPAFERIHRVLLRLSGHILRRVPFSEAAIPLQGAVPVPQRLRGIPRHPRNLIECAPGAEADPDVERVEV